MTRSYGEALTCGADADIPSQLKELRAMVDPFVPVLALWAEECGRIVDGRLDKARWEITAAGEGLEGSHWLLAYGGATRGRLGGDGKLKLTEHEVFGWLSAKGASFFDGEAIVLDLHPRSGMSPYQAPPDVERAPKRV